MCTYMESVLTVLNTIKSEEKCDINSDICAQFFLTQNWPTFALIF